MILKRKPLSEETKRKISISHKGLKHTVETKKKISELKRGQLLSQETKQKISEGCKKNGVGKWMLGKKLSPETKEKLSKLHTGNKYNLGRKQTQEEIEKRKLSLLGNSGVKPRDLMWKENENGCHLVTSHKRKSLAHIILKRKRKQILAHRFVFEQKYGKIPEGLCVCHKCDVPACINPEHLFLGTRQENAYDRHNKQRDARGESNGQAKLSEKQVKEIILSSDNKSNLAEIYRVSYSTINHIKLGRTWKHITKEEAFKEKQLEETEQTQ